MKLKEDCQKIGCTFLVSVPRLYNRIVESVIATVNSMVKDEAQRPQIEAAVFAKTRMAFGDKIKKMATGSAPINPAVQ